MKDNKYVIGVDLGGTNTVFGAVDKNGNIYGECKLKTREYPSFDQFVAAGCDCIMSISEIVGEIGNICAIGIGAPNGNCYSGCIELAPNLPWKGIVPIVESFNKLLHIPVVLTNDANAAAVGEMMFGVAKGMRDFIEITLGTGVGSGIVINGELVSGHDGFAGELGHVIMVRGNEGRLCGCGRKGCLETYCSASGMVRTAKELLTNSDKDSLLRKKALDTIESKDIYDAAVQGDELAKQIFEFTGDMLGRACADFAAFSSPEAFVFFGGVTNAGELIMNPIKQSYEKNVFPVYKDKAKFLVSELNGKNAAVLGSAALGFKMFS